MTENKIRVGISACLLGEKVRFDGGHKRDYFLTDSLGPFVDYVPVCPEVEMGLPTPREALRLVGDPESPRLVFSRSGEDVTDRMQAWAARKVRELERENLCGFIFKSRSPSSGMERVKLYDRNGVPNMKGVGLFARACMAHFPQIPVEEEGRLHDPGLRENFIECLFTFQRWRQLLAEGATPGRLTGFHTAHKLLILAHSPQIYREMGRLVASVGQGDESVFEAYPALLMKAMRQKATPAKHTNVLQHILGYFKKQLSSDEKQEALEIIASYHDGKIPLIVPVTLMNHFVRRYRQPYLQGQIYLNPHPLELRLRNHA